MDKLKELEIKKTIKELNYIESEYNYKNELINEIEILFIDSVNEFLEKHIELKTIFDEIINENISKIIENKVNIIEDEILISDEKVDEKIIKIKNLYRKIVKITHPDIIDNKKYNELYLTATKYYNNLDIPGIYLICDELDIEYLSSEEDIVLIKDKIDSLKEGINIMESNMTWKWYYSEDSNKDKIILEYIKRRIK
jgi:hypothetical protein